MRRMTRHNPVSARLLKGIFAVNGEIVHFSGVRNIALSQFNRHFAENNAHISALSAPARNPLHRGDAYNAW
jgi:hypothetical protein